MTIAFCTGPEAKRAYGLSLPTARWAVDPAASIVNEVVGHPVSDDLIVGANVSEARG